MVDLFRYDDKPLLFGAYFDITDFGLGVRWCGTLRDFSVMFGPFTFWLWYRGK